MSLIELCSAFALLSLVAFGGGNAVLPEMHRLVVEQHHWLSDATFSQLFALAQAAPGPNILVVSLIGLQLAGVPGFFALTAAFCLPAGLGMYAFTRWWERHHAAPWRPAVQAVVGPLAAGLVLAGGGLMAATAWQFGWAALPLTLATALLTLRVRVNPLWWIALGALLGALGVV